jgi:hypothetical protein
VLGDVGAPQSVGPVGDEDTLHEVVVNRLPRSMPALVTVRDPASTDQPQQPCDTFAADPDAGPEPQLGVHPRGAVGAA